MAKLHFKLVGEDEGEMTETQVIREEIRNYFVKRWGA